MELLIRMVLFSMLGPGLFATNSWGFPEPRAKRVIRTMDRVISDHIDWDDYDAWSKIMERFFVPSMISF